MASCVQVSEWILLFDTEGVLSNQDSVWFQYHLLTLTREGLIVGRGSWQLSS